MITQEIQDFLNKLDAEFTSREEAVKAGVQANANEAKRLKLRAMALTNREKELVEKETEYQQRLKKVVIAEDFTKAREEIAEGRAANEKRKQELDAYKAKADDQLAEAKQMIESVRVREVKVTERENTYKAELERKLVSSMLKLS